VVEFDPADQAGTSQRIIAAMDRLVPDA